MYNNALELGLTAYSPKGGYIGVAPSCYANLIVDGVPAMSQSTTDFFNMFNECAAGVSAVPISDSQVQLTGRFTSMFSVARAVHEMNVQFGTPYKVVLRKGRSTSNILSVLPELSREQANACISTWYAAFMQSAEQARLSLGDRTWRSFGWEGVLSTLSVNFKPAQIFKYQGDIDNMLMIYLDKRL